MQFSLVDYSPRPWGGNPVPSAFRLSRFHPIMLHRTETEMRARTGLRLLIPTLVGFAAMVVIVQTPFTSTAFADDVVPFKIQVPDAVLEDLKHRLEQARFADEIPDANWDYGTNAAYLKALVGYWRDKY